MASRFGNKGSLRDCICEAEYALKWRAFDEKDKDKNISRRPFVIYKCALNNA